MNESLDNKNEDLEKLLSSDDLADDVKEFVKSLSEEQEARKKRISGMMMSDDEADDGPSIDDDFSSDVSISTSAGSVSINEDSNISVDDLNDIF